MRSKNKFILSLFLSFLLIFSNLAFVYAEDEIIDDTQQLETEEEVEVEEQKQEELPDKTESKKEVEKVEEAEETKNNEEKTIENIETTEEPQTNLVSQENTQDNIEIKEHSQNTNKKIVTNVTKTTTRAAKNAPVKNTSNNVIEIETAEEFNAVIADLNTNGGSKTIKLKNNIALTGQNPQIRKGELTILGEGYTLEASLSVFDNGKLNLGADGYENTLDMPPGRSDLCVINTDHYGELNIYNGVTIRDCTRAGQSGGIQSVGNSVVNMYGGTITNCHSKAVSGGIYLDGNSIFNMKGGIIENCTGFQGGAVGLAGGHPFGPEMIGSTTFNMEGGIIQNCTDLWIGGGAVGIYTYSADKPVAFIMNGGTIQNCTSTKYGYGGAISFYTASDTTFIMNGGQIINNNVGGNRYGGAIFIRATNEKTNFELNSGLITGNEAKYGAGVMIFSGNLKIADNFELHNNSATDGGDDIYNNGTNVTLGAACATAVLTACNHLIDGWYDDGINARWSYTDCTGEEQHLEEFTELGVIVAREYGLKAAHGLNPKEPTDDPVEPDEPVTPDEPQDPIEPTIPTDTTPTKINPTAISTTTKTVTKVSAIDTSPITDDTTPVPKQPKTTTISEPKTPKTEQTVYWALINLILSILTVICGFIYVMQKTEDKRANKRKLMAAGVALISVIIFIFTEDMNLPMTYTDKWTFPMILPLIIEIINLVIKRNKSEGEDYNG